MFPLTLNETNMKSDLKAVRLYADCLHSARLCRNFIAYFPMH